MRIILLTLTLISFLSCRTNPPDSIQTDLTLDQCHIKLARDGRPQQCLCRKYKVSQPFIGPLESFREVEMDKCDLIVGYRPVQYTQLHNLMEYVREEINYSEPIMFTGEEIHLNNNKLKSVIP